MSVLTLRELLIRSSFCCHPDPDLPLLIEENAMSLKARLLASFCVLAATSVFAASVEPVLKLAGQEKDKVVPTLKELVNIESGSRDTEGLGRLAEIIRGKLADLGGKTELVDVNTDIVKMHDAPAAVGKVVVARFEGSGSKRIMLLGHMDTVYPRGTLAKRPFRFEGGRAYGPGIADDKGGIALMLHSLAMLKSLGFRDYKALTVVINADEEISTLGARNLITRLGAEHDVVLSCEPPLNPTQGTPLSVATTGIGAALLTVRGKSAHAGVNPQDGRNALIELSHQLLQSRDLSDPARGIKFNWTVSQAGTVRNVIPDIATAAADVRVQKIADYDIIEKAFKERVKTPLIAGTTLETSFERRRPPLEATEAARAVARKAQAIYAEIGRKLDYDDSGAGGGTDAAFAAASGKLAVVESFGFVGYGFHSPDEEYLELDSIEPRLYLMTRMVMELSK
jgi:glutamate carboxypeptidase